MAGRGSGEGRISPQGPEGMGLGRLEWGRGGQTVGELGDFQRESSGLGPKEVPRGEGVPSTWNFSRFLSSVARLEEEGGLIAGMTGRLREQLMEEVEDFGEHLGDDGKGLRSHSTGRKHRKTGQSSDPEADWGRHETSGKDGRTGRLWRKIRRGFGYRIHLIAATPVLPAIATNETETVGRTEGFADAEMRQAGSRNPLFTAMTPLPSRSGACRRPVAAVWGHLQHQSAAGNPYSACASAMPAY